MSTQPTPLQIDNCLACAKPLIKDAAFCAYCGTPVLQAGMTTALATYIDVKLASRLKDQVSMVREVADKAEDIVWKRFKGYAWITGILTTVVIGFLGFYGWNTINGASERIAPIIKAGEEKAQTAKETAEKSETKAKAVKDSLDKLSTALTVQTTRLNDKNSDISTKLTRFDAAQKETDAYLARSQELSQQLDDIQRSLTAKVQQISKQVDDISIRRAYPNLGKELTVSFNGEPWKGKAGKKAPDKWVSIAIEALSTGSFSTAQLETLVAALKKAGYTPLLGLFGVSGPYQTGFTALDDVTTMQVAYFRKGAEPMAAEVSAIASKIFSSPLKPKFVDTTQLAKEDPRRFIIEQSGLDLQIFLSRR